MHGVNVSCHTIYLDLSVTLRKPRDWWASSRSFGSVSSCFGWLRDFWGSGGISKQSLVLITCSSGSSECPFKLLSLSSPNPASSPQRPPPKGGWDFERACFIPMLISLTSSQWVRQRSIFVKNECCLITMTCKQKWSSLRHNSNFTYKYLWPNYLLVSLCIILWGLDCCSSAVLLGRLIARHIRLGRLAIQEQWLLCTR